MDKDFEIVARHADPPANWKSVDPELAKYPTAASRLPMLFLTVGSSLGIGILVSGLVFMFSGLVACTIAGLVTIALTIVMTMSVMQESAYAHYATWIFETTPAEPARVELAVKSVDRYGNPAYFATVTDATDGAELYDVKSMRDGSVVGFPVGSTEDAQVHRDPNNRQAVVAFKGNSRLWLQEFLDEPMSSPRLAKE